jgi:hypothetical protein
VGPLKPGAEELEAVSRRLLHLDLLTVQKKTRVMKKADPEGRKPDLITGLRDVRERILTLASSLPPSQHDEIYVGTWSSREMLAHLAGWDDTNIEAAKELLVGELPTFYEHSDKDWASYNAKLVAEYRRDEYEDLFLSVRSTHSNLIALIEDLPAGDLWMDRGIRARG